jgi:hypothetical protein
MPEIYRGPVTGIVKSGARASTDVATPERYPSKMGPGFTLVKSQGTPRQPMNHRVFRVGQVPWRKLKALARYPLALGFEGQREKPSFSEK